MSDLQLIAFILFLLVLIIISGFFSGSETALMAVNRYKLRHKARIKRRYALRLLTLLKRPDRLLGAILIGNTFANILASSLATLLALHLWGESAVVPAAFVLTLIILIFAEITPKTVAAIYPDQVARWVSYPIQVILKVFYPFVWAANTVANFILRLLRVPVVGQVIEPLSREELRSVVYDTTGKLSRQYQNMLLGILDLSKLTVDDVMVPRNEISGINLNHEWDWIVSELKGLPQDWIPCYRGDINQLTGVLYTRDIFQSILRGKKFNLEWLENQLREPYFVPEGTPLSMQLSYFQRNPHQVAFVVDEYGEILGLLTLQDIVEEIVGDFNSSVVPGKRIRPQADGSYMVEGGVFVREFNRATDYELPKNGPRTINGLIVEYLESMPHEGTTVLISDYPIEIVEVTENRVKLARVFPSLKPKEKNDLTNH